MATSQPIDPSAQNQRDEGMMTLREHLVEFRWRLTISVVAILVCSLTFWPFKDFIFDILQSPLGQDVHLQQIEPTEAFFSFFKVAVLGGIGIASPVVLYQIMAYVSPGLYPNEKRIFYASIPAMLAMFFIGVMFCWFVILRFTLNFLTGFAPEDINTELSIDSYVSFVARMLLVVGLVFETPFAIFLLAKFRIVSAQRLKGFRRYAIVVIVILAAVITPTPDPLTQMAVAIPMYALYELGVLLAGLARTEAPPASSESTSSS
ncbi:MAG: twin-arginine translocase subunit TatC [Chloroflexi bacterium]|nr:twin-arginine translocase subunit TatC [Chloroflexota bacterium]